MLRVHSGYPEDGDPAWFWTLWILWRRLGGICPPLTPFHPTPPDLSLSPGAVDPSLDGGRREGSLVRWSMACTDPGP